MPAVDNNPTTEHSQPIPIDPHHSRRRSQSISESSSSDSSVSAGSPVTPTSPLYPRVGAISPSSSPILSYFLAQSPTKSAATFPFRRGFGAPVAEDDEDADIPSRHARRASTTWTAGDRFAQPPAVPVPSDQQDRAAGLLRRLSLGGSMTRPVIQNPRAPTPTSQTQRGNNPAAGAASPARKARRANTINPKPPRAPSPMGERILKGHFDGFN